MKRWCNVLLQFGLVFCLLTQGAYAELAADEVIKMTTGDVLNIIKSDTDIQADKQKAYALIEEKVLPNFDLERLCRLVLGKHWKRATAEQQTAFRKEFRDFLIRTYALALTEYKGQNIEYKPLRAEANAKVVTVNTLVSQANGGPPIAMDYWLRNTDTGWKVFDIVIEKISLINSYRSQFSSEIKQNGLDGLIKKLAEKNKSR